jgi:hypothetical protein
MIRYLLPLAFLLCAGAAPAQQASPPAAAPPSSPAPQSEQWLISDKHAAFLPARTAFPLRAGTLSAIRHHEFSNDGEGIDNAIQYGSPDGEVTGTVYLYYPGLPHSGLAAYATDRAIRHSSETPVEARGSRVVGAGKVPGVAIRLDYGNYRNGHASSAAFIKAGRWIIKVRVSGPEARRAEVETAFSALLDGIMFGRANPAHKAAPLKVSECAPDSGKRPARLLPDPPAADLAAAGLLATFDGGGIEATDEKGERQDLPSRVPEELCVSSIVQRPGGPVSILRGDEGPPLSVDGRTMLVAVITDSGMLLEVVHAANLGRYYLLFHQIGATFLLGGFDDVPSDAQIAEILENPDAEAARPRVPVTLRPGRGPAMHLPAPSQEDLARRRTPTT